jgi:alpha-D-xyloside xylohydrolase
MDPCLDPRSSTYDTDVLLRDHRLPLLCVRSVRDVEVDAHGITLHCETVQVDRRMRDRYGTNLEVGEDVGPGPDAVVRFDAVSDHVLRMRLAQALPPANLTPMLAVSAVPSTEAVVEQLDDRILLKTAGLTLTVWRAPFCYEVRDERGAVIRRTVPAAVYQHPPTGESDMAGQALADAWPWFFRDLAPMGFVTDPATGLSQCFETGFLGQDEALYGFGERFLGLDKRGQAIRLWHANAAGKTWPLSYKNVPFFLSSDGYGHFTNSARPITYHVGDLSYIHHSVHVQDSFLDTFLVAGPDLRDVLNRYTALTGTPAVPPTWSFGLWMSRMSYREQSEVLEVARRLREESVPCDVIHIDTDWFATEWVNDLEFSPERFPDPAGMVATLRDDGFRLSLWQIPYISVRSAFYPLCKANGWFATGADGEPRLLDGFFGSAAVLDFSHPDAAGWYTQQLLPLFEMGVAAIKTDFGEGAPIDADYAHGDSLAMHNLYPLLYNRAVFERTLEATGEPILWGRSAYAGSQRYPVYWGGDPAVRWEDLGNLLYGGLGLGLCGFPFWSQDIGGFAGTPTPEQYIRWAQVGLFMTHPRAHGPIAREPWSFGPAALDNFRHYAALRYRLLPYVVSEALALAPRGEPVMRPLLLDAQDDPATWRIGDQFLLGRDLMVAPVLTEGVTRRVYLPAGRWVRWEAGRGARELLEGGTWHTVHAPLAELPLFLREGSLVPMVDPVQHTGQLDYRHLTLQVVCGRPGSLELARQDGPTLRAALHSSAGGAGWSRVELDPAARWTLEVHGLAGPPTVTLVPAAPVSVVPLTGGSVRIPCPPGTCAVDLTVDPAVPA